MKRVAFLGPAGTFSEDALLTAAEDAAIEPLAQPTVHEAIMSVARGDSELALVPFENSIEGSVRGTLDTLAFDTTAVAIVGEYDHPIRHALIARSELQLDRIEVVLSHPQASAQCSRFIREHLPSATVRASGSTAEAVRDLPAAEEAWAALGAASAAAMYGCIVLREGVEDTPDNVTRFVWIAPGGTVTEGDGAWRTSLVFAELGDDHPGALVEALQEFSSRGVNLSRIESRPLRQGLGRYMFFIDIDGRLEDAPVEEAIARLRGIAESVRVLGSYPVHSQGIPTDG